MNGFTSTGTQGGGGGMRQHHGGGGGGALAGVSPEQEMALLQMLLNKSQHDSSMRAANASHHHHHHLMERGGGLSGFHSTSRSAENALLYHHRASMGFQHQPANANNVAGTTTTTTTTTASTDSSFPLKLASMLSNPELMDVVTWMPHGRAWKILNLDCFIREVLPMFFENPAHQNFNRFVQMLKTWGFQQFTKGLDASAYYHKMFLRGMPQLRRSMRPQPQRNVPLHNPSAEPDFYALPDPLEMVEQERAKALTLQAQQRNQQQQQQHQHQQQQQRQLQQVSSINPALLRQVIHSSSPQVQALRNLGARTAHQLGLYNDLLGNTTTTTTKAPAAAADAAATTSSAYRSSLEGMRRASSSAAAASASNNSNNRFVCEVPPQQSQPPARAGGVLQDSTLQHLLAAGRIAASELDAPLTPTTAPAVLPSAFSKMLHHHQGAAARTGNSSTQAAPDSSGLSALSKAVAHSSPLVTTTTNNNNVTRVTPDSTPTTPTTPSTTETARAAAALQGHNMMLPLMEASSAAPSTTTTSTKAPSGGKERSLPTPKLTPKKARRKWLPPLGPKESTLATLKFARSATTSSSGTASASTHAGSDNSCDWYFSNPETFASLNDQSK